MGINRQFALHRSSLKRRQIPEAYMEYELPEELRMLKDTLRRFIDNEVIPIEREAYDGPEMVPDIRAKLEDRAK